MKLLTLPKLLFVISILHSGLASAQRKPNKTLESAYTNGEVAFFEWLAKKIRYPEAARTNGVMGLSVLSFKVDCNNNAHSFKFKTILGAGIEDELQKTLEASGGYWVECDRRDSAAWVNLKVAFSINKDFSGENADLVINAIGPFPGFTDQQLKKNLEKATLKGQKDKMKEALRELVMRFPYEQDYKKKLIELLKEN